MASQFKTNVPGFVLPPTTTSPVPLGVAVIAPLAPSVIVILPEFVFEFVTNCWLNIFVKKENQELTLLNSDDVSNKRQNKDNFKTTNVNILLNRVRLDKKKTFKKRIIISFFLVAAITSAVIYFII